MVKFTLQNLRALYLNLLLLEKTPNVIGKCIFYTISREYIICYRSEKGNSIFNFSVGIFYQLRAKTHIFTSILVCHKFLTVHKNHCHLTQAKRYK